MDSTGREINCVDFPIDAIYGEKILFNPLNAELNPICHLLALLGHRIFHVSKRRVSILSENQWRTEREGWGFKPPPPEFPKALQNRAKFKPIVQTVKI